MKKQKDQEGVNLILVSQPLAWCPANKSLLCCKQTSKQMMHVVSALSLQLC